MKNYKCSQNEAASFFYDNILRNEEVAKLIINSTSEKQLSKNATFREFVKKHKKELYYRLRKYKSSDESKDALLQALDEAQDDPSEETKTALLEKLAAFHVSSQERFKDNAVFYQQLAGIIGDASLIVDVGCGVQPLFFPHEQFPGVTKYIALDKDRESIAVMSRFRDIFKEQYEWLHSREWSISEGWDAVCAAYKIDAFDAALILKVVPVVRRVDAALLNELAKVPAKTIVVSGVKESMVKKHDIERKERRAITSFINAAGREQTGEFELDNEFFIIVS